MPARSPDLNLIENFFHLIQEKLCRDALNGNITEETFEQFSSHVRESMVNFPVESINRIIDIMDRRIFEVLKKKGERLRY